MAFDAVLRSARGNVRKWESMNALEKRTFSCEQWESMAGALNDAYHEQRAGHVNYRLTAEDVLYARRVAVWMRFELARWEWNQIPENGAAADLARRVAGQTGPTAVLSDEVRKRLDSRPKAPDTWDPPYLAPDPSDKPRDWPEVAGMWSVWLEQLVRIRQAVNTRPPREPGDDVVKQRAEQEGA